MGNFLLFSKIQAETAILSLIFDLPKIKEEDFNRHQFFFHKQAIRKDQTDIKCAISLEYFFGIRTKY